MAGATTRAAPTIPLVAGRADARRGQTPQVHHQGSVVKVLRPRSACRTPDPQVSPHPRGSHRNGRHVWHERRELNPQWAVLETAALPIELHSYGCRTRI